MPLRAHGYANLYPMHGLESSRITGNGPMEQNKGMINMCGPTSPKSEHVVQKSPNLYLNVAVAKIHWTIVMIHLIHAFSQSPRRFPLAQKVALDRYTGTRLSGSLNALTVMTAMWSRVGAP